MAVSIMVAGSNGGEYYGGGATAGVLERMQQHA